LAYPKIFLLRLKQLQRGEWTPRREAGCDTPQPSVGAGKEATSKGRNTTDEDLMEKILRKEREGKFDEELKALLAEKQRRARERRQTQTVGAARHQS
jgi:hypothetical protein